MIRVRDDRRGEALKLSEWPFRATHYSAIIAAAKPGNTEFELAIVREVLREAEISLNSARNAQAAKTLIWRCNRILLQGRLEIPDRVWLPQEMLAMAGVEAEEQKRRAVRPRKPRKRPFLRTRFEKAYAARPGEKLDELLQSLQGDEVVTSWDPDEAALPKVHWIDEDGSKKSTARGTVKGWHKECREK